MLSKWDVVWARMKGHPLWPAIIHPVSDTDTWWRGKGKFVKYHVVFLAWDKQHAWLPASSVVKFNRENTGPDRKKDFVVGKSRGKEFKKQHEEAIGLGLTILDDPENPLDHLVREVEGNINIDTEDNVGELLNSSHGGELKIDTDGEEESLNNLIEGNHDNLAIYETRSKVNYANLMKEMKPKTKVSKKISIVRCLEHSRKHCTVSLPKLSKGSIKEFGRTKTNYEDLIMDYSDIRPDEDVEELESCDEGILNNDSSNNNDIEDHNNLLDDEHEMPTSSSISYNTKTPPKSTGFEIILTPKNLGLVGTSQDHGSFIQNFNTIGRSISKSEFNSVRKSVQKGSSLMFCPQSLHKTRTMTSIPHLGDQEQMRFLPNSELNLNWAAKSSSPRLRKRVPATTKMSLSTNNVSKEGLRRDSETPPSHGSFTEKFNTVGNGKSNSGQGSSSLICRPSSVCKTRIMTSILQMKVQEQLLTNSKLNLASSISTSSLLPTKMIPAATRISSSTSNVSRKDLRRNSETPPDYESVVESGMRKNNGQFLPKSKCNMSGRSSSSLLQTKMIPAATRRSLSTFNKNVPNKGLSKDSEINTVESTFETGEDSKGKVVEDLLRKLSRKERENHKKEREISRLKKMMRESYKNIEHVINETEEKTTVVVDVINID